MEGDKPSGLIEEVGKPDDELRMKLRFLFKHARQKQEYIEAERENDANQQADGQIGINWLH